MSSLRAILVAGLALTTAGGALLGQQAWLCAKAALAERLIERAFDAHLDDGQVHLPWSWADTWPVARLEVPRLGVRRTVLAGASGSTLAFGPGNVDGTALPNRPGNSAVAGHRDGSFAFLRELQPGDRVVLTTLGDVRGYTVDAATVRSMWDVEVLEPTAGRTLTLITCYPFDGSPGSPWRYVVTATSARDAQLRYSDLAPGGSAEVERCIDHDDSAPRLFWSSPFLSWPASGPHLPRIPLRQSRRSCSTWSMPPSKVTRRFTGPRSTWIPRPSA